MGKRKKMNRVVDPQGSPSQPRTGAQSIQQPAKTYRMGEKLAPESREREYKEAQGGFMAQQLYQTVARYVCGFLNSQVEGKLILGVTDKCEVVGVDNRFADKDRQIIDQAMRNLKPPVLPEDYSLIYCDILDNQGNKLEDKSVVELTVFRESHFETLYETSQNECWQRRDASTEKMSPQQIQHWLKKRFNPSEQDKREIQSLHSKLADWEKKLRDLKLHVQQRDNDARNQQTKCEELEKVIERSEEKCTGLGGEIEQLKMENKELNEQIREKNRQSTEEADSSLPCDIQDAKNHLQKKKQSKVCAIS